MDRKITLEDIAKAAGVSRNTVSVVLRGRPGVSDAVRARVLRLAESLNYEKRPADAQGARVRYILVLVAQSVGAPRSQRACGGGTDPAAVFAASEERAGAKLRHSVQHR